jgi:hypothetical protein
MLSGVKGGYEVFNNAFVKIANFKRQSNREISIYTCNRMLNLTAGYRGIVHRLLELCQEYEHLRFARDQSPQASTFVSSSFITPTS